MFAECLLQNFEEILTLISGTWNCVFIHGHTTSPGDLQRSFLARASH